MKERTDPLLNAVMRSDLAGLQALILGGWNVDHRDDQGRTPLMHAILNGDTLIARALVAAGADVNLVDRDSCSALHFAAQRHSAEATQVLLEAGANVDAQDRFGNTPLHRAVFECRGRRDVVHLLLAHGANREQRNVKGVTPLGLSKTIANFDVASVFQGA